MHCNAALTELNRNYAATALAPARGALFALLRIAVTGLDCT